MKDLVLESVGFNKKIQAIKAVREMRRELNMEDGLKICKDIVESVPVVLIEDVTEAVAHYWMLKIGGLCEATLVVKERRRDNYAGAAIVPYGMEQPQKLEFGELEPNDVFHSEGVAYIKIAYIPQFICNAVRLNDRHLCLFYPDREVTR